MKEASGEASMTGITIALIAIVAAVAIPLVNNVLNNNKAQADCLAKGCGYDASKSGADKCVCD